jgi:glycosyltransferase 2 family protein
MTRSGNHSDADSTQKSRRTIINVMKIVVSVSLVFWLFQRIGSQAIVRQLTSANWWWILAAVATFAASNVLGALQWHILLRSQNVPVSFRQSLSFYHVGLFFNNFLIGNIGGDALRIYDVRRFSGDGTIAVSTVVFDRFIGFLTLTSVAMAVSLLWIRRLASLDAVYVTGMVLLVWVVALFFLFNEKAGGMIGRIFRPLLPSGIAEKIHAIYSSINQLRNSRRILSQLFSISVIVQLLRVLTHYLAALSVGARAGIYYFFIFIPIIALLASLPISFGGIGVREQSAAVIFATVGLAASKVVTFEFLAYLVGVLAALPGGLVFILRKEEKRRQADFQNANL